MSSWGKTDVAADAPKYLTSAEADTAFFVDITEAGIAANRAKGLKTPGWNLYKEYTDANGGTRRVVENLVAMKATASDAGDDGSTGDTADEDATVADS